MPEGITLKRIINMDEATELTSSDYALVDSATGGPKKFALGNEISSLKEDFTDLMGDGAEWNYIDISSGTSVTSQGIRFEKDDSTGTVRATGTAIAQVNWYALIDFVPPYDMIARLSGCPSDGSDSTYRIRLGLYREGGSSTTGWNTVASDYGDGATCNLSANSKYLVVLTVANGATVDITFKPVLTDNDLKTVKDMSSTIDSLSTTVGGLSTTTESISSIVTPSEYIYKQVKNYSHDFNDQTETGTMYINSSSGDLLNAPLGLVNGAFMLTNLSAVISSKRNVIQLCYVQSPTHLRGTVWYRFFNAIDKTVIVDWVCATKSFYKSSITLFGDSITAGYPQQTNDSYHWWAYLQKYFDFVNFATSGAGIIYTSSGKSGVIFADQFTDTATDYLCVFMGTNDYGNNMTLGSPSDSASKTGSVCAGLKYLIETVMSVNSALSIIGILPLNRCDKGNLASNWAYGTANEAGYTLNDLCDALKTVYESYGIPVIDNRQSVFQKMNLNSLLGDNLHPNLDGYRKLAQHLGGEINRIITPIG